MDRYKFLHDKYFLTDGNGKILENMDEVAICLDVKLGVRLSHGSPKSVLEYYEDTVQRLKNVNYTEAAEDIIMIQGKFPVEELNKLLEDALYISTFVERIK